MMSIYRYSLLAATLLPLIGCNHSVSTEPTADSSKGEYLCCLQLEHFTRGLLQIPGVHSFKQ